MSASEQLYKLAARAQDAETNVAGAKEKGEADLKLRVAAARAASEQRAAELKDDAAGAEAKASSWWSDVQGNWKSHVAQVRANVDDTKAELDAKRAEHRAEQAEDDAVAAVEFAYAALEEAEYAVLDAALARLDADAVAAG